MAKSKEAYRVVLKGAASHKLGKSFNNMKFHRGKEFHTSDKNLIAELSRHKDLDGKPKFDIRENKQAEEPAKPTGGKK